MIAVSGDGAGWDIADNTGEAGWGSNAGDKIRLRQLSRVHRVLGKTVPESHRTNRTITNDSALWRYLPDHVQESNLI